MTQNAERLVTVRREIRSWLAESVPVDWRTRQSGDDIAGFIATQREWLRRLVGAGYATPHWPAGWPGGGRPLDEQIVIFEEIAIADAPRMSLFFVSLYHAAMTLVEWGSDAQKRRHLHDILNGQVWCQGFSEPNAGSDLASLRTRAERCGDRYVVNGQKIWSTLGHYADWCLLLVRTGPLNPKQAGISFLLMDMKSPGVEVRPIRQITGDEEFAEIFLTDVEIPVENLVGNENEGWRVAQTTLASERGLTLVELSQRLSRAMHRLMEERGAHPAFSDYHGECRSQMVELACRIEALRAMIGEVNERRIEGKDNPGDASVTKLAYTRILREFLNLGLRIAGPTGQRWSPYVMGAGFETGNWMFDLMNSYQWSIAGGSNEIQRNLISERVLNMPKERPQ